MKAKKQKQSAQSTISKQYPSYFHTISGSKTSPKTSVHFILPDQNVILVDYRPTINTLDLDTICDDLMAVLNEMNLCDENYLMKMLYRVLLNPNQSIQDYLYAFKQTHYHSHRHVLGIQVRLGGCLANYKETVAFMTMKQFYAIPSLIKMRIQKLSNPVVYLSTDSDYAEQYIRSKLPNVVILTSSKYFTRLHTTGSPKLESVESALVDLILLADSDVLLYQKESGFGRIAASITRAEQIIEMKVNRVKISGECEDRK